MEAGTILLALVAGLVSFLSPCIIPMLSVYFALITGLSVEELEAGELPDLWKKALWNTAGFVLGFTLIFTLAGGAAGQAGKLFGQYLWLLNLFGGILVVLIGLRVAGWLELRWFERLLLRHQDPSLPTKKPGFLSSFLIGLIFAVACSHCIAPTLYSILLVAGATGSAQTGMLLMLSFSIGLALPYLAVGVSYSQALRSIRWLKRRSDRISKAAGLILVTFGLLMISGRWTILTQWLTNLLPYRLPLGM